jgi:hypothetical protein
MRTQTAEEGSFVATVACLAEYLLQALTLVGYAPLVGEVGLDSGGDSFE